MINLLITSLLPRIMPIIEQVVPDSDLRLKVENQIRAAVLDGEKELFQAARDIIVSETKSESGLARSWRPLLMYVLMTLLVWLGVLSPLLGMQDVSVEALERVPEGLWSLLSLGMGGYIGGRSLEKIVKNWSNNKGK